ncbi:predicted protein [Naegleria gruberi]|uniref:Predicted protein n=1 Tax=Naegleria gruberi TaxID=5762 RepID=D2VDQ8_NAEGR|nr:uncharacterized protein NAEGRDRAFT_67006 [Naegleria gruberi]EFC44940.1 predicted protein [Naegleria gruberi]|eukprot:XP_002677684.1 predicted protein [Naegleria gruberi strain NEG-M]
MTNIPPLCSNQQNLGHAVDIELPGGYSEVGMNVTTQLVGFINDQNEDLYHLVNAPTLVDKYISKLKRVSKNGAEIWTLDIQSDCSTSASVVSQTLSFASDGTIVLSGWIITKERACFRGTKLSSKTSQNNRKVPFIAFVSSTGYVISVISLENDFPDASISHVDLDHSDSNKLYLIIRMDSRLLIACYNDGRLMWNNVISSCADPSKCQAAGLSYSPFGKILVTLYESDGTNFQFAAQGFNFVSHKSGIYIATFSSDDGLFSSIDMVFHSTSVNMGAPKTVLDRLGKLHLLIACEANCYISGSIANPGVFLLRYYNGAVEKLNRFISLILSKIKLQSLALDRDLSIYAIINGLTSFSIIDDTDGRVSNFLDIGVLCKFRYSDGKILWLRKIADDPTLDYYHVSPSSIMVNKKATVDEIIPTMFTYLRDGTRRTAWIESYTARYDTTESSSARIGGSGGSTTHTTSDKVTAILFGTTSDYVRDIGFEFKSVPAFQGGLGIRYAIDSDEYFTSIDYCVGGNSYTTVEYIKFNTNKKSFSNGKCRSSLQTESVPKGKELVGFTVNIGIYLDSIKFYYRSPYICMTGTEGDKCDTNVCYGISSKSALKCSGKGNCVGPNTCSCYFGYFGSNCEQKTTCFGIDFDSKTVCSGNGNCYGPNTCRCNGRYTGNQCQYATCNGIIQSDSKVCSGHGSCIKEDTCSCQEGYSGPSCSTYSCSGILNSDSKACSTHGVCSSLNNCTCLVGYFGSTCNEFECGGINAKSNLTCTGRGICSSSNNCKCLAPNSYGDNCESCKEGYYGSKCEKWNCNGIENTSPDVCGGRGQCVAPNQCKCTSTATGSFCEQCVTGYFGLKCGNWTCNGIENTATNVCNHRGSCIAYDNCQCSSRSYGSSCESCVGLFTGALCSECSGHLEGDEECLNYAVTDPEYYAFTDDNRLEFLQFIVMSTGIVNSTDYACSKLFTNLENEIGIGLECTVRNGTVSPSNTVNRAYLITVKTFQGTMSPSKPIHFNIFWANPQKKPSYTTLNISVKEFYTKNSIGLDLYAEQYRV